MKKYKTFLIFLYFPFFGCDLLEKSVLVETAVKKKMAKKTGPQEKQTWTQIKNLKGVSSAERINKIDSFIQSNRGKEIVLPAYMLKAELLLKNKKNKQACSIYYKVVNSSFDYINRWKVYPGIS